MSSWTQRYIVGEIAWNDYQVLLNSYNRAKKTLSI
jgi:hypothetical protein